MNKYYFTFGFGQEHVGKYVIINATSEDLARKRMFDKYGPKWAFCYNKEGWFKPDGISQAEEYGYELLEEIENE